MCRLLVAALTAVGLLACHLDPDAGAGVSVTSPTRLCGAGISTPCLAVTDAEKLLGRDLEIIAAKAPPAGVQGARVLTLRTTGSHPVVLRAKWRADSTTTRRNSPRLELAAYGVQKLFLPPGEVVVPPTAPYCFPIAEYRVQVDATAQPTFKGIPCVYGILSLWLEDVQSLGDAVKAGWFHGADGHMFDATLFDHDRIYKDSITRVNLFTYVIAHADSHARNFVITVEQSAPLVYSIDNSLSLGMPKNPGLEPRHDWSRIRVSALPRVAIDRLRHAGDRLQSLGAVATLHRDGGRLVATSAATDAANPTGMDWAGDRLTVGLTPAEIDGVRRRIAALLDRIDRGEIAVY